MEKTYVAMFTNPDTGAAITKTYSNVTEEQAKYLADRYASFSRFQFVSVMAA